jgi:hypothetical protein
MPARVETSQPNIGCVETVKTYYKGKDSASAHYTALSHLVWEKLAERVSEINQGDRKSTDNLTLQRHFHALTKFAHVESRLSGHKRQRGVVFYAPINLCDRRACSTSDVVGLNRLRSFRETMQGIDEEFKAEFEQAEIFSSELVSSGALTSPYDNPQDNLIHFFTNDILKETLKQEMV